VGDIEEIKKLKARYFRGLDTKDWDLYRSVFTDDMVFTYLGTGDVVEGLDAFMDYASGLTMTSVHHGHMPEIDLTSPDSATGIWSMEDHVRWDDGFETHGYGHYFETYEKVEGRWRIKTMKLAYLRSDRTPYSIGSVERSVPS
jgi:uncharacterized protein (TIGR02246 family)